MVGSVRSGQMCQSGVLGGVMWLRCAGRDLSELVIWGGSFVYVVGAECAGSSHMGVGVGVLGGFWVLLTGFYPVWGWDFDEGMLFSLYLLFCIILQ